MRQSSGNIERERKRGRERTREKEGRGRARKRGERKERTIETKILSIIQ